MNDTTRIQLKTIVERAVRPVRASSSRKQKMREELLAHVSGVYEEESAKPGGDQAALERTALRFGNPAEVTNQLEESVPVGDGLLQFWEGRPGESKWRGAFRFIWVGAAVCLALLGIALFAAGLVRAWSREELLAVSSGRDFLPLWVFQMPFVLAGFTLVMCWMERSLRGGPPLGDRRRTGLIRSFASAWAEPATRVAMTGGGLCLFALFTLLHISANWPAQPTGRDYLAMSLAVAPFTGGWAAASVFCAWIFARSAAERRWHHAEWSSLPLGPSL
ncbi:hypothetical protein [Zavarzinella formosa]|uniref:hypothetical protein n=1 Tax=Zavarzinella formosa TaxID=360055 RepID=UPI0002E12ECA|nr:hypothetical protein [Zavarzinella formosa]